jgi:hypothetical protein
MILLVAVEEMQKDELRTAVWKVRNLDEPGAWGEAVWSRFRPGIVQGGPEVGVVTFYFGMR